MTQPENRGLWASLYRNHGGLVTVLGTVGLAAAALTLNALKPMPSGDKPAEKPPAASAFPFPPMEPLLDGPKNLANYQDKHMSIMNDGMHDKFMEEGEAVDCGSKPPRVINDTQVPDLSIKPDIVPVADAWPGFQFEQEGTPYAYGDRMLWLGREDAVNNIGDTHYLTDGWAVEYRKAQGNYQIFHFFVERGSDDKFPAFDGRPAQDIPQTYVEADAETGLLSVNDLKKGVRYHDGHTTLWASLGTPNDPTNDASSSQLQPHFTIACNNEATPQPTAV